MTDESIKESKQSSTIAIPSAQIINLIQHHLIESGLTESSQALQVETQIGSSGLLKHAHTLLIKNVKRGEWGAVLQTFSNLTIKDGDGDNEGNGNGDNDGDSGNGGNTSSRRMGHSTSNSNSKIRREAIARAHEMAILELGDAGEMDLAFATLKICRNILDEFRFDDGGAQSTSSLGQIVERRLHAINALRSSVHNSQSQNQSHGNATTAASNITNDNGNATNGNADNEALLPSDYYGPNGITKEKRRQELAKRLGEVIPIIPQSRLVSLLQQSIKWQVHTGEMPMIKEKWIQDDNNDNNDDDDDGDDEKEKKRKKKSKKDRSRKKKRFDLVLGQVDVQDEKHDGHGNSKSSSSNATQKIKSSYEKIPLDPYSIIKFSKKTVVTSSTFYIDVTTNAASSASGADSSSANSKQVSLITGSSDGFIEIWDESSKYTELRLDLDYQKKDELMCHYGDEDENDKSTSSSAAASPPSILAMTVNIDGTMLASGDSNGSINIWNLKTGTCLRTFDKVHNGAITCLDFSRDGEESSKILSSSQDGNCREFGLRTCRMLKEFSGHNSFVNCCNYVLSDKLLVVTASADGTVRVWDGRSAETLHILNPVSATGPSAVVSLSQENAVMSGKNIHTVLHLHTPANSMVVIPRGPKAFLITCNGAILRTFTNDLSLTKGDKNASNSREDFIAGVVSPTNKWLYLVTDGGLCICFDLVTGKVETIIRDFGIESTGGKTNIEVTGLTHHPHKGILGAYSSSPALKRGLLTIWK
jgi:WD40 repeat-containing protein SMU1